MAASRPNPEHAIACEIERMRWLLFAHADAPVDRTVVLDGIPYRCTEPGSWRRLGESTGRRPDDAAVGSALAATSMAKKKRDAAPSWSDLIDRFGESGVVRNRRGKIVGYRYPRHDDPEKNLRQSQEVYEMWQPHRRVSINAGAEANANIRLATLVNEQTGQVRQVDERHADTVAPAQGFVPKTKHFTGGL